MRIGYCSLYDPCDKKSWSGLAYYIMKALEKHCGEVVPLGPINSKFIFFGRVLNKVITIVTGRKFDAFHTPWASKELASILERKLRGEKFDYLVFPSGSEILAFLDTDIPKVYISDATFDLMVGYYPYLTNLMTISKKWGEEVERSAIRKADIIFYFSQWAANSAINHYCCDKNKIHVVLSGGNLDTVPSTEELIKKRKNDRTVIKLLFIGVDWNRKGGELAYEAVQCLNERGFDARLIVCGCSVPGYVSRNSKVTVIPFLNKNKPDESLKFYKLYEEASFFFLPTRNECFGLVLIEASAYCLPIVTTNTGGVSDYVEDNVNGAVLSFKASAREYAENIQSIWADENKYIQFCLNSRRKFDEQLNWNSWGHNVAKVLSNMHISRATSSVN